MADTWPTILPQDLLRQGYSEALVAATVEYVPDAGPSTSRRRTTAVMRTLAGSMHMTGEHLEIFLAFVTDTLGGGVLPFNFPNPRGTGTVLVKFSKEGFPRWQELSIDLYQVSFSVMILP